MMSLTSAFARKLWIALACLVAATTLQACASRASPEANRVVAVIGGAVIDPASNDAPQQVDVIIRNDRIVAVGPNLRIPHDAELVDATGKFLVPGLWDSHAHFAALTDVASAPELYVGYGILSVRDMGGDPSTLNTLHGSLATGSRIGPNLFLAGPT